MTEDKEVNDGAVSLYCIASMGLVYLFTENGDAAFYGGMMLGLLLSLKHWYK